MFENQTFQIILSYFFSSGYPATRTSTMAGFLMSKNITQQVKESDHFHPFVVTSFLNETAAGNRTVSASHETARVACQVGSAFFTVTGGLESLIAVFVLCSTPGFHGPTDILALNLMASGLVWCLFYQPVLTVFFTLGWVFGGPFCRTFPYLLYSHLGAGLLSMMAICVQHYCQLLRPAWNTRFFLHRTPLFIIILLTWSAVGMVLLMPLFRMWGDYGYDRHVFMCSIVLNSQPGFHRFALTVAGGIPCIIIVACLSHIGLHVYFRDRGLKTSLSPEAPEERAKIIAIVFFCWVLCYMPMCLINAILDSTSESPMAVAIAIIPLFSIATINPIIYFIMVPRYRQGLLRLCCRCTKKCVKNTSREHLADSEDSEASSSIVTANGVINGNNNETETLVPSITVNTQPITLTRKMSDTLLDRKMSDAQMDRKMSDAQKDRRMSDAQRNRRMSETFRKLSDAQKERRMSDAQKERRMSDAQKERRTSDAQRERRMSDAQKERKMSDAQKQRNMSDAQKEPKVSDPHKEKKAASAHKPKILEAVIYVTSSEPPAQETTLKTTPSKSAKKETKPDNNQISPQADTKLASAKPANDKPAPQVAGKPASEARKASLGESKPGPEAKKPAPEARKPSLDASKPGSEAKKFASEARKPSLEGEANKPSSEVKKPISEARKSSLEASKPESEVKKPASEARKSGLEARRPSLEANKPGSEARKPASDGRKPSLDTGKPISGTRKASLHERRPGSEARKLSLERTPSQVAAMPVLEQPIWQRQEMPGLDMFDSDRVPTQATAKPARDRTSSQETTKHLSDKAPSSKTPQDAVKPLSEMPASNLTSQATIKLISDKPTSSTASSAGPKSMSTIITPAEVNLVSEKPPSSKTSKGTGRPSKDKPRSLSGTGLVAASPAAMKPAPDKPVVSGPPPGMPAVPPTSGTTSSTHPGVPPTSATISGTQPGRAPTSATITGTKPAPPPLPAGEPDPVWVVPGSPAMHKAMAHLAHRIRTTPPPSPTSTLNPIRPKPRVAAADTVSLDSMDSFQGKPPPTLRQTPLTPETKRDLPLPAMVVQTPDTL